jgi:hypothetical protein
MMAVHPNPEFMNGEEHDNYVIEIAKAISLGDFKKAEGLLGDLGVEHWQPPTDAVNKELEVLGSNYRLIEIGDPQKHCSRGPHGGGCLFIYKLAVQKLGTEAYSCEPFAVYQYCDDDGWLRRQCIITNRIIAKKIKLCPICINIKS